MILVLSLVDTRFVLLFLEFTKKILASVYERSYESSIISPSEKPLLKILAARWFYYRELFAFKKTRAKRVHSCFCFLGVSGGLPLIPVAQKGRSPLCVCWLTTFKSIVSTLFPLILIFLIAQLSLVKNCP